MMKNNDIEEEECTWKKQSNNNNKSRGTFSLNENILNSDLSDKPQK